MMKLAPVILCAIVLIAAVALDSTGTYLAPVLLGMALTQGAVLLVAASELSNAKWIAPVKRPLLALTPVLFLFPFLVPFLLNRVPYPWLAHPNRWLTQDFFLVRNVVMLVVLAIVANIYRRLTTQGAANSRKWAVIYIFTFVTTKTLVAMDWTMSFDYPWISTMFPALYMIESLYAGIVLVAVLCFVLEQRQPGSVSGILYDGATLFFGFALFWGGLFYAQYLTIWYANLPEEVHYFTLRFHLVGGRAFFYTFIALLFLIPFCTLLIHKARKNPSVMFALAHSVLIGLLLHRVWHILPHVNLNLGLLVVESVAMFGAVAFSMRAALNETPAPAPAATH
jgi:hypothetical protein